MKDALCFPADAYTVENFEVGGRRFAVRAWRGIHYCAAPVDDIQRLDLYAPEAFFHGQTLNGYDGKCAPVFMPNTVGGYMPGPPAAPETDAQGQPNPLLAALMHGCVVACAGIRGRSSRAEDGAPTGKAPAFIVDMKAAIRYLRHNAALVPGDTEKIITSGTSAGGALSALTGASGNAADYAPYLAAIGAAEARDDVFAANCYCPIINLEHADAAYEWQFGAERCWYRWGQEGELTEAQLAAADALKQQFPAYLNSLALTDENGLALTLEPDGTGSFLEWLKGRVMASAQRELETGDIADRLAWLMTPGSAVRGQAFLRIADGTVSGMDWAAFVHAATRMKAPPAFDALDLGSWENDEFADEQGVPRHFSAFSHAHSAVRGEKAEERVIRMMNPMTYVGKAHTAPHFRIRHGTHDRDTSLAVSAMLALALRGAGVDVDFRYPWGLPHSGDYDLPELFAWMDRICRTEQRV